MREKQIKKFWDRSSKLNFKNRDYHNFVKEFLDMQLKDDCKITDLTTDALKINKNAKAVVTAKEKGIIAGLQEFKLLYKDCILKFKKKDGEKIKKNDIIAEIEGNLRSLLKLERTGLNILQRMSGIATITYNLNGMLENLRFSAPTSLEIKNKIFIGATRKTYLGQLDKRAVSLGRGLTHRLNLSDAILIKDNHIRALNKDINNNIKKALQLSAKNKKTEHIEIEVENMQQAVTAAKEIISLKKTEKQKHFALMFDNIKPDKIKSIVKRLKKENLYNHVLLEASGGINPKNIKEYAETGVDFLSIGYITHSSKALNINQHILR